MKSRRELHQYRRTMHGGNSPVNPTGARRVGGDRLQWVSVNSTSGHAIITGATSPIGETVLRRLVTSGYTVTIAARVLDHARATVGKLDDLSVSDRIAIVECDLASLDSVRSFAAQVDRPWDLLLETATAALSPYRSLTDDGCEWNFGINYLAHFVLAAELWPRAAPEARIITTTSPTASTATLKLYDLRWDHGYRPGRAYASSRLATMIWTAELARRLDELNSSRTAVLTHPGFIQERPRLGRTTALAERIIGHSAAEGAQTLVSACDPDIPNGSFIVPDGPGQLRGEPTCAQPPAIAQDRDLAGRLWRMSEQLSGVPFLDTYPGVPPQG